MNEAIVWIDSEFSGTSPQTDKLLEIASVMTNLQGEVIGYPFEALFEVNHLPEIIENVDGIVRDMHDRSGLWFDLWNGNTESIAAIETKMLNWISDSVPDSTILYFGGNSITKDRNFVEINLPRVYRKISHQSVDVTSLAIALKATCHVSSFPKKHEHRALSDVRESIDEYCHYMNFIRTIESRLSTFDEKNSLENFIQFPKNLAS